MNAMSKKFAVSDWKRPVQVVEAETEVKACLTLLDGGTQLVNAIEQDASDVFASELDETLESKLARARALGDNAMEAKLLAEYEKTKHYGIF